MIRSIFFYENEELTFTSILRIFLLLIVLFFILAFPITTFGNLSNFAIGIIYSLQFFTIFLIWTPHFNAKEKKHSNVIFSVTERIGISASLLIPFLGVILVFFFIRDKRMEAVKELKRLHEQKVLEKKKKHEQEVLDKKKKLERKRYENFVERQKKKGLIEYNGKWGTPEQVKTWKEIDVGLSNNFANITHFDFEQFIAKLFRKMGYHATVTRKTGDYGIDVIAKKDDDIVAIQVKKNSHGNNVSDIVVQNTLGGMWKYKANKAIIITTSDFTTMAHEQAKEAPIELWNKRTLHQMVKKYFVEQN
ncbi:MAG: restriction endonuclease [Nanoarchaeota archaeon]|nr:restriction endonuclease [Nanoarchaeota archaeon]